MRSILLHSARIAFSVPLLVVAVLAAPAVVRGQPNRSEAVEAFEKALDQDLENLPDEIDPAGKDKRKEILDKREKTLKELSDKITTLLDLAEVLRGKYSDKHREMLRKDKQLREIDTIVFEKLLDKFVAAVKSVDSGKDTTRQCAIATLMGDMVNKNIAPEALRGLIVEKLLIELDTLAGSSDPEIQTAVARAIGKIVLELRDALGARARNAIRSSIAKIQKSKTPEPRRAVIDTAGSLVRVYNSKPGEESDQPVIPFKGDLDALVPLTPILFVGMQDTDAEVRGRSLEVMYRLNSLLNKDRQVFIPISPPGMAPRDFKLEALTEPYLSNVEVYHKALLDSSAEIRLTALQNLEELTQLNGYVRDRVLNIKETQTSEAADTFLEPFLKKIVPDAVTNLSHPHYRVRLAASQVIESRGYLARSAAASLVPRLADDNLFVRWAAARALGHLNNPPVEGTVEGLARLLSDEDISVRMAAANAVESLGAEGREAAPALLKAVGLGDADFREVALRALGVVGPHTRSAPLIAEKRGQMIVPVIAKELTYPDARVRRAAAQALTRFGTASAVYAGKELKAALDDEDADVRRYATEALLKK